MNRTIKILAATAVLSLTITQVFAQQQLSGPRTSNDRENGSEFAPPPDRDEGGTSEERREEVRKKIEAVRIWRLTEKLKLDATTSAKLSSFLSSMDLKRRETMKSQMELMKDLRLSLRAAKPDEAKVRAVLAKLEKNHHEMQKFRDQEMQGLKDFLTIEQQARFLLFQHDFQHEIRGMVHKARGNGQGRGVRGPDRTDEDNQRHPPRGSQ